MSPALRLLMVSYEFPPLGGGTGNAVFHVLRELARISGAEIDLLTSEGQGPPPDGAGEAPAAPESVAVHRVRIAKSARHRWTAREIALWTAGALRAARRLARERRYDLCHCWSGWPSGLVGYSIRRRVPYLVALRGSDVPGYNPRLHLLDPLVFRRVARAVWGGARARTCVSRSLAELARRTDPAFSAEMIGNGVDARRFRPGERSPRFAVLYVGRLIERKGLGDLVEAFASVRAKMESARLEIVGEGPERARLGRIVRRLGVEESVAFRGALDGAELEAVYRQASVFVLPALAEAMSNAALEAMASGLPLVTTPTGTAEILDGNGIVVEPGAPSSIARALLRYVDDEELRRRHALRSRAIAETLTWEKTAREYLNLYDRIAGDSRK